MSSQVEISQEMEDGQEGESKLEGEGGMPAGRHRILNGHHDDGDNY